MYVYIYISYCTYHTSVHTNPPTYIPTYIHTYVPMFLHTYVPMYVRTQVRTYTCCIHMHTCISAYIHPSIHTYRHTHTYIYIDIHRYIDIYIYVYIHIYIYIHTYIYICIYIYIYISHGFPPRNGVKSPASSARRGFLGRSPCSIALEAPGQLERRAEDMKRLATEHLMLCVAAGKQLKQLKLLWFWRKTIGKPIGKP